MCPNSCATAYSWHNHRQTYGQTHRHIIQIYNQQQDLSLHSPLHGSKGDPVSHTGCILGSHRLHFATINKFIYKNIQFGW